MKRLLIAVVLIATAAGAVMLVTNSGGGEWTTDSKDALREFELGLEARMKYYTGDALEHFSNAVELDPDFTAARLYLANFQEDWSKREALQTQLREEGPYRLTPRERFLLDSSFARWDRETARALEIAEKYTAEHPEDVYGLATLAEMIWGAQEWDEAERLYREILKIDPNWVTAQNRLGYIALARGRFEEAEDLFVTYKYIAPDQANPHDSMGELLVLLGRYSEASVEFDRALEIRPDFCSTYQHQIDLVLMSGEPDAADQILDRASEHCSERMVSTLRCSVAIWTDFLSGNSETVWSDEREECRREMGDYNFLIHRTACETGRLRTAEKTERELKMRIEAAEQAEHIRLDFPRALLLHMEGTRLMAEEQYERAAEAFQKADDKFLYWGEGQGILKLYNQVNLAMAQKQQGLEEPAEQTFQRIRAVNPAFADYFHQDGGKS